MSKDNASLDFKIIFETRDRLSAEMFHLDSEEFDEIDELRRLSEEMSTHPMVYMTRS